MHNNNKDYTKEKQEIIICELSQLKFNNNNKEHQNIKNTCFNFINTDNFLLYPDKQILFKNNNIYKVEELKNYKDTKTISIDDNEYSCILQEKKQYRTQLGYIPFFKEIYNLQIKKQVFKLTPTSGIKFIFEEHNIINKYKNSKHRYINSENKNFNYFYIEIENDTFENTMIQEIIKTFITKLG